MTANNINLNIVARADTAQARSAIRSLSNEVRQANRTNANALNVLAGSGLNTLPIARVSSEMDNLTNKINKGKLAWSDFRRVMQTQSQIIRRQAALTSASLVKTGDSMRGIERGVLTMDNFSRAQVRAIDRVRLFGSSMRGLSTHVIDFGKNMQWAGRQITVGFTVPFVIAGGLAARQFMKLEDQVIRFEKVFNEGLGTSIEEGSRRAKDLAIELTDGMGRAADETMEVAASFAQMGKSITQVEQLTRETMRLSTLGEVPVDQATDLLRGIQAVFGVTNEELSGTVDLLNAIENNTALTMASMADSIPQLLPIFDQFNLSLGQGVGIIAGMNETLGNANEAANAFKAIAQRMFDPTQEAIDKFAELGINLQAIVSDNEDDLLGFFKDLGIVMEQEQLTAEQFARSFGNLLGVRQAGRGLTAIKSVSEALRGVENDASRAFGRITTETDNAADAQSELNRQLNSLPGRFRRMVETIKVDVAEIGEVFMEVGLPVLEFVSGLIKDFSGLDKRTKKIIVTISALVAAFGGIIMFGGIFTNLFGNFMKMFANLLPGMKLVTAETRAAALAMDTEELSARELLNTMLGLDIALDNAAASQNSFAAATRNASSAMSAQQTATGTTGTARFVPMGNQNVLRGPGGKFAGKPTFGPAKPPAHELVRSPSRPKTDVRGTRGMGAGALMTAGMMGSMFAGNNAMAQSLSMAAMLVGSLSMLAPLVGKFGGALTKIPSLISRISFANMAKMISPTGLVIAGIAAVGIGIQRWISHVDTAANRLKDMGEVADGVADSLGLRERAAGAVEIVDEEGVKTDISKAVTTALDAVSGISRERFGSRLDEEFRDIAKKRAQSIVFDVIARGGDIEAVREIVSALERETSMSLEIDVTNIETALSSISDHIKANFSDLINRLNEGKLNAGTAGRLFQMRDFSQLGTMELGLAGMDIANIFATGSADFIREQIAHIREELKGSEKTEAENVLVDQTLINLGEGFENFVDQVSTFDQLLAITANRLGPEMAIAMAEFDTEMLHMREGLKEAEGAYNEHRAALEATAEGLRQSTTATFGSFSADVANELVLMAKEGVISRDKLSKLAAMMDRIAEGVRPTNAQLDLMKELLPTLNERLGTNVMNTESFIDAMGELGDSGLSAASKLLLAAQRIFSLRFNIRTGEQRAAADRASAMTPAERSMRDQMKASREDIERRAAEKPGGGLDEEDDGDAEAAAKSAASAMRQHLSSAFSDLLSDIIDSINKQRESRISALDDELELLQEVKEAEDDRDAQLLKRYRDELDRMQRLRGELQDTIDFDAAVARGELDAAAALSQEMMFSSQEDGLAELEDILDKRSKLRDDEFDSEKDRIDDEKEAIEDFYKARMDLINEDFELLKRTTPKTVAEWQARSSQIEGILDKHGIKVTDNISKMAVDGYNKGMDNYRVAAAEDKRWEDIGDSMAKGAAKAAGKAGKAVNDEMTEQTGNILNGITDAMIEWIRVLFGDDVTDDIIKNKASGLTSSGGLGERVSGGGTAAGRLFHTGGKVPGHGDVAATLLGGEYVLRPEAVRAYGTDFLDQMNANKFHDGGFVFGEGAEAPAGGLFGGIFKAINNIMTGFTSGVSGMFSDAGGMLGQFAGSFAGGGAGNASIDYTGGSGKLSIRDIFKLALGQGLTRGEARIATAVALGESGGNPRAFNPNGRDLSYGLWQINMLGAMGPARRKALGLSSNEQLWDPHHNARAMNMISSGGDNWQPWTVYTKNIYKKYLDDVDRGIVGLAKGGRLRENNVLANLHKGEAVLRAPIASSLEAGIRNLEQGGGGIHLTLEIGEFHGTEDNIDLLARKVEKVLDKKQAALGRKKVFG